MHRKRNWWVLGGTTMALAACGQAPEETGTKSQSQALVQSILTEGFESGLGAVTVEGNCATSWYARASGTYGLRCDDVSAAEVQFSTEGFSDVTVRYTRRTNNYDSGEVFVASVSYDGGSTFEDLEVTGNDETFRTIEWSLSASADENPNVVLRFSSNANGAYERFDLDDVVVEGTEQTSQPDDCDGVDNDGDGQVDEDFVSEPVTCGIGACTAFGETQCVNGSVESACTPGQPAADDATCDGEDDDCDGEVDEDGDCGVGEPEVLLFDTFDNLDNFTETGEGDWNVESLHSASGYPGSGSGSPAAHADNCDSSCELTLTSSLDLSGAQTATLELLRFVDGYVDAGEYLAVELFDGSTWNTELYFTDGAGDDNTWHAESLDLTNYLGVSDFRIRLSTSVSSSYEHVQVDDLRVTINGDGNNQGDFVASSANLQAHVAYLTQQPRGHDSAFLDTARDYCADELAALGYQVERMDYTTGAYSGQNIIGTLPGNGQADERVLVSAHVDGIDGCLGADDNASGVAGTLETARLLAQGDHSRTAVVACWDTEELNLGGSTAYAQRAASQGENINVSIVYEMIGYFDDTPGSQDYPGGEFQFALAFPDAYDQVEADNRRGDFIALVADDLGGELYMADIVGAATGVGLDTVAVEFDSYLRENFTDGLRSDHKPFWDAGYSAVMITDTAEFRNPYYHCQAGPDDIGTLDFDFMRQVVQATSEAARDALDD